MKKLFLTVSAACALIFSSCDNENTVNPEPQGVATIKGTIYSNLDEEEDEDTPTRERVPADVPVYFYTFDYETEDYTFLKEVRTDANGLYTTTVEGIRWKYIKIVVGDFETEVNTYDGNDDYSKKPALYNDREYVEVEVSPNQIYTRDIEIGQPQVIEYE